MPAIMTKKTSKKAEATVKYPEIIVMKRWAGAEGPLTPDDIIEMFGVTTDAKEAKAAGVTEPLYTDLDGNSVYFTKNKRNRPFYEDRSEQYGQDLLNKRWAGPSGAGATINGETMIFDIMGDCESGQHQGAGLLKAEALRRANPEKWRELWGDGPVVMDKLVVVGISNEDIVVNTIDTAKARTLTDVLYRLPLWGKAKKEDRRTMSAMLDSAVKFVWSRTGMGNDAFSPYRTHAEAADFIDRHPKLLKCVTHIFEENGEGKVKLYFSPGYAAGLMYLMAASESDSAKYHNAHPRTEKKASLSRFDKAQEFWSNLVDTESKAFQTVRAALGALAEGGSLREKTAIIIKAWSLFIEGKKLSAEKIALVPEGEPGSDYTTSEKTGVLHFTGKYSLGGIDATETDDNKDNPADVEEAIETTRKKKAEGSDKKGGSGKDRKKLVEEIESRNGDGEAVEEEVVIEDEEAGEVEIEESEYEEVVIEDEEDEPAPKAKKGK